MGFFISIEIVAELFAKLKEGMTMAIRLKVFKDLKYFIDPPNVKKRYTFGSRSCANSVNDDVLIHCREIDEF
jgi:hypothetical protein